jgi:hypothetical protein
MEGPNPPTFSDPHRGSRDPGTFQVHTLLKREAKELTGRLTLHPLFLVRHKSVENSQDGGWESALEVEHLPVMHKALSSIPSTTTINKIN